MVSLNENRNQSFEHPMDKRLYLNSWVWMNHVRATHKDI